MCPRFLVGSFSALLYATNLFAASTIDVQVDQPGHAISPHLWGIFFEDINLSADGGIYPEQVRNRSFEDNPAPEFWSLAKGSDARCELAIDDSTPLNPLNRKSLRIDSRGKFVLENGGYWGMNVAAGDKFAFSTSARSTGRLQGPVTVQLVDDQENVLAEANVSPRSDQWRKYEATLIATKKCPQAKLRISGECEGDLFLDMVSLLPNSTWKNHGLRPDLCEMLDELKPSFFRFPGGCWVEGENMSRMYQWKKTIGDVSQRTPLYNIWGYNATHGLGYHEYLQLAEDLGAEPLFCLNCGMSHREVTPMEQMAQWVQDALDAIEYANGPVDSVWGAQRAAAGHPEPFNLKYVEVGNENGGPAYNERWPLFVKAIKTKHPEIVLVANHWLGDYPRNPAPDVVDEHYYNTPEFFMEQAGRYDDYDRKGPKIFVGEFAVTQNGGQGNLRAAIGEAAFMTGVERNSDVVNMACYAPLLVNMNHRRWNPDLINFDSHRVYGIPGYYVQQLFSQHRGDKVLPVKVETKVEVSDPPSGGIGVGCWNTQAEYKDIKVTDPSGKVLFEDDFAGGAKNWKQLGGKWTAADGALKQTVEGEFIRALAGDRTWTDYTLELKARKIAGREGFLILFHNTGDDDRTWWNLGGWANTQHALELGGTVDPHRAQIETNRWYDIKIVLTGERVQCYLDGKLIHDAKNARHRVAETFASASLDEAANEVIVKVVNTTRKGTETTLNLPGMSTGSREVKQIVLTADTPTAENSLENPTSVAPKSSTFTLDGNQLKRQFPGNSLTVLRIPLAPK